MRSYTHLYAVVRVEEDGCEEVVAYADDYDEAVTKLVREEKAYKDSQDNCYFEVQALDPWKESKRVADELMNIAMDRSKDERLEEWENENL